MFLRNLANFCKRLDSAVLVVDMHDGNQCCRLANGGAQLLQANPAIPADREIGYPQTRAAQGSDTYATRRDAPQMR